MRLRRPTPTPVDAGGWFKADAATWDSMVIEIASRMELPEPLCVNDLRWWVDQVVAPHSRVEFPTRRELAERWGRHHRFVRELVEDRDLWCPASAREVIDATIGARAAWIKTRPNVVQNPPDAEGLEANNQEELVSVLPDGGSESASRAISMIQTQTSPDYRLDPPEEDHDRSQETLSREGGTGGLVEEGDRIPTPSTAEGSNDPVQAHDPGSSEIVLSEPECHEQQITPPAPPGELVMLPTSPSVGSLVDEVVAHWHGKVRLYGPRAGRPWHPSRKPTPRERELLRKFVGTYGKAQAIDLIDAYHDGPPGRRNRHNDRGEEYVGIETLFKPTLLGDRLDKTAAWVEAGRPVDTEEPAAGATSARSEPRPEPAWKLEKARRDLASRTFERLAERIGQSGGAWRPPHFEELEEARQWNAAAVWAGINAVGVHCGDGPRGGLGAILRTKRRDEWEIRRVFVEAFVAYDGEVVHQTEAVYVESESGGMAFGGDR